MPLDNGTQRQHSWRVEKLTDRYHGQWRHGDVTADWETSLSDKVCTHTHTHIEHSSVYLATTHNGNSTIDQLSGYNQFAMAVPSK